MAMEEPLVTIGVPVLNEEAGLPRTLAALTSQTHKALIIHVADNGSTDATPAILAQWAAKDPRIKVERRPATIPAPDNFARLALAAQTPYFMFAAGDDVIAPDYVARNLALLEANPSATLSVSRCAMVADDGSHRLSNGTRPLTGSTEDRLRSFLRHAGDNSRFYGLHRTPFLQRGFRQMKLMAAFDWLVLMPGLLTGDHLEVPEVLMHRHATPIANYRRWVTRLEPHLLGRILPHARFARAAAGMMPPVLRRRLWPDLARAALISMANSPYPAARGLLAAGVALSRPLRARAGSPD